MSVVKEMTGADRLAEVAEWLERGAPHVGNIDHFDMDYIAFKQFGNSCGTTCCIGGALMQFEYERRHGEMADGRHDGVETILLDEFGARSMTAAAGGLAEMEFSDASALFFPNLHDQGIEYSDITPAQAAKVTRNYLETGEVDWSVALNEYW